MRSRRNEIEQWKKKAFHLKQSLSKLRTKHTRLEKTLQHLNLHYEFGNLSYSEYSKLFDRYVGHLSAEEWQTHYRTHTSRIESELETAERRIESLQAGTTQKALGLATAFMVLVFMTSLAGIMIQPDFGLGILGEEVTGAAVSAEITPITANATIEVYLAIAMSSNLSNGIGFGSLSPGTSNNNATDNYNGNGTNSTTYIEVSSDSNVNVDFCLKANTDLKNGTDKYIEITNLTFANASTTVLGSPSQSDATKVSATSDTAAGGAIAGGGRNYYRFWLDIPTDSPPLLYNNTITFTAVQEATTCP